MKKTLSPARIADIRARASALTDDPVQPIEFTAAEMDFGIDINIEFEALPPLLARPSTPIARAPCPGTKKISIRMPNALTQVFKDEAKRKGTQYQTLMIRILKESSKGW